MDENDRKGGSGGTSSPAADTKALNDRLGAESDAAINAAADAGRTIKDEASALGAEARDAAAEQAETVKETAASHLDGFADALRAASDELGRKQGGPAAEMVANAASGLEGFARSLHGKSTGEMVDKIRQFGRENPIAFLAGSALAGLALGRFATAAPGSAKPQTSGPSSSSASDAARSERPVSPALQSSGWRPEGELVRASVAQEGGAWSTAGGRTDER